MDVRRGRKRAANSSGEMWKGSWPVPAKRGAVFLGGDPVELHAPESPGVHKAEFPTRSQMQDAMGMPGNRGRSIGDQQAAGHAQMHDPLQAGRLGRWARSKTMCLPTR